MSCTRALFGMLWQAPGACRAAKFRRNSVKFSRFHRKITVDESKISRQKASLSSRKPVHHQHPASKNRPCFFWCLVRVSVAATALICKQMQSVACKVARISTAKLRNLGAERARRTQEKRANSFQMLLTPCHALVRVQECFVRRRARVARQNCADIR